MKLLPKVLLCTVAVIFFLSHASFAADYVLAPEIQLQPYAKWSGEVPTNLTVKNGQKVYLQLKCRINAPTLSTGSTSVFRVFVDRVPLDGARVANKQESYHTGAFTQHTWYSNSGKFEALYDGFSKTSPETWGRLHEYAFDVTNLIVPGKPQKIIIEYLFNGVPGTVFEIENCRLTVSAPIAKYPYPKITLPYYLSDGFSWARQKATSHHAGIDVTLDTSTDFTKPLTVQSPLRLAPFEATASGDAQMDMAITFPGWKTIPIHTTIGTPQKGWQTAADFAAAQQSPQVWQTSQYRLQRKFQSDANGIIVEDHVTNLTEADLPFAILYQMDVGDLSALKEFRVNGEAHDMFYTNTIPSRATASYPVGYVRDDKRAYAFVMEDDAMRPSGSTMAWDSLLNFGTDMCYLKPGASHTFRFRIIGSQSGDYFEILNRLRAAWNNYQTIPGLFGFVYPLGLDRKMTTPGQVKRFFDQTGITVPTVPNRVPVPGGTEEEQRRMVYGNEPTSMIEAGLENTSEPLAKLMKEAGVDVPLSFYTDVHLVRTDDIKHVPDDLADGTVKDIFGNPVDYRPGWLHVILPLTNNSVGKRFRQNLDAYFAKPYIGGIFLDEWDHSRARYDFSRSDGLTARLKEDLTINAKIDSIPLMTKEFQQQTIAYLQEKKPPSLPIRWIKPQPHRLCQWCISPNRRNMKAIYCVLRKWPKRPCRSICSAHPMCGLMSMNSSKAACCCAFMPSAYTAIIC